MLIRGKHLTHISQKGQSSDVQIVRRPSAIVAAAWWYRKEQHKGSDDLYHVISLVQIVGMPTKDLEVLWL